ncbi:hypothetical protein DENSPDRAFT_831162 [Dentipellis sp. KUC8613]|nr:hypothetical protein DENSPDRAFT_831162 [Dentipellis sp. KUC8613]
MMGCPNSISPYSLFPTAPSAPHAFSLFGQSPRETHQMYEELQSVVRQSGPYGSQRKRASSVGSLRGLKKFFSSF